MFSIGTYTDMNPSKVGVKRRRDDESLRYIPRLTLSQHPHGQRKHLFMMKLNTIIRSKSLHPTQFEGYTVRERFERMGWEQLLKFSCDKIYKRVVIQWTASLSRNGDELTGIVDGKSYTITPTIIRDLLGVDTRKDLPYARFNKAELETNTVENKRRWVEACKTVFGIEENAKKKNKGYDRSKIAPLVKILWQIGLWTFHPRLVQSFMDDEIYRHEIYLLHALFTGDYLYSFAQLMIDNIWDMYEHEHQQNIPHGYYLSEVLYLLGAVSEDEYVEIVSPQCREISRIAFHRDLAFSESSTEYIIDDRETEQRVTFPKVIQGEAVPRVSQTPLQPLAMTRLLISLQNLTNKLSSESQKQHEDMMATVTKIQKQMERQALEAERREQERERQAVIRAHAIIWDIERQRYFYEQEQEKLHKAWKQANGSGEFQFPSISHTSFHPPKPGSQYYDPDQGDEIPKEFQDLFRDIYGTRL